jgi:exosortase
MKATAESAAVTATASSSDLRSRALPFALVAITLIAVYYPVLERLVNQWANDEDMGHGFFVPAVALYVAWQRKDELFALPFERSPWGLAIMAYAALQGALGILGAELFLARSSFVIELIGITLFAGGMRALRILAFPLILMFFMIPIPSIIYTRITFPLQLFASRVAEICLTLIGIPVLREGNVLELADQRLSVVEACSGIRSLLSLSFLSLVYGYFFDRRPWVKYVLFVATVPIAILANSSRVTITGILTEYKPELAKGFFHSVEGWVIFMVALAMLLAVHQLLIRGIKFYEDVQELKRVRAQEQQ